MRIKYKRKDITVFQMILFSFLSLILLGSMMLMLPISSLERAGTSFLDALFTATSAVCVTGLVVHDTATYWSGFGQTVILTLIQIGGMGVITVVLALYMMSGRKIGLSQRQTLQEAVSAPHVGGIIRHMRFILKTVFLMETAGALLMLPIFLPVSGVRKGFWYSIFHSISAFCNAGFDLMGTSQPFSSLTSFSSHIGLNLIVMFLIIAGGIGFLTWEDIWKNKHHIKKYRMQSKVILMTSFVLILLPALYFFFFEFQKGTYTERILSSFFQSVTTRTAGFNTRDLTELHDSGKLLMIFLMLIGGSPGSTAGGMKTTTFAVVILCMISVIRYRSEITCFQRRIAEETVRKAVALLLIYVFLSTLSAGVISYIEGLSLLDTFFETASAIGTVGLTLGITPTLGTISRLLLITLMLIGRVGGLTFIFAAVTDTHKVGQHYPQEKITVG